MISLTHTHTHARARARARGMTISNLQKVTTSSVFLFSLWNLEEILNHINFFIIKCTFYMHTILLFILIKNLKKIAIYV